MGATYSAIGRHPEAKAAYLAALDAIATAPEADAALSISVRNNLAFEYRSEHDYAAAAKLYADVLSRISDTVYVSAFDLSRILAHYQQCLRKMGQRREARAVAAKGKAMLQTIPQDSGGRAVVDFSQLGSHR